MYMSFLRRSWQYMVLVLIIGGGATILWQRNTILDHFALRNYQSSAEVTQLVTDTSMTPYAKRLFYVNHPVLQDKDEFNAHCTDETDQVATLGCYLGDRGGIFLYNVTDERLAGVEQVTAAHEMLHQAFDRLSSKEKQRITALLEAYNAQLTDPTIQGQMESYKDIEPTELVNEMHSIFGTQVKDLPAELETYYAQYFTDRSQIVDFYAHYRAEFDQRRQQIQAYDNQLAGIKKQIETHKSNLSSREQTLRNQRAQLDRYLEADQIVSYNAAVPGFNALVNAYRSEVNETNRLINEFNSILDARNAIAVQEQELQKALDSKIDSAQ